MWLAIGRRGGKDTIAGRLAAYLAVCGDFAKYLRRGERGTIACVAVTRERGSNVIGYIKAGLLETVLAPLVEGIEESGGKIALGNGIDIIVLLSNYRSLRGRSVASAILGRLPLFEPVALESVRKAYVELQSFRSIRRIDASRRNARALRLRFSKSFARRRHRLSHAKVRSTTQRIGSTTKPLAWSDRFTISTDRLGRICATAVANCGP